ncbi:MAG: ribosome biogenesis GTPase YlqF [Anaerovoracaceae bacterium]|jgi:ribosome biogenesis GTPase A
MIQNINWYPGHMKKTRELIQQNLKLVDVVIEVVDARIPISSRNPVIDEIISGKPRIIAFNKSDLADEKAVAAWIAHFRLQEIPAIAMNANTGAGVSELLKLLEDIQEKRNRDRLRNKPLRLMIVGVPNVGKSSLINRLTGRKSAKIGDRPGVTRGKQWLAMENGMQLLDTPGILWPKFEDQKIGLNLAFCGSIKDEIMDVASLALELIRVLSANYPDLLLARYKMEELGETPLETMEAIAQKRGFILSGKRIDYERTGRTILDEFRSGLIGKITLEHVNG